MNLPDRIYHLQRKNNPKRTQAISFPFLGKLGTASAEQLHDCQQKLRGILLESLKHKPISKTPLIIGLAESGIIPSALMHQIAIAQHIQAHWICSTRRSAAGIPFIESHSHETHHTLPLPNCHPTELWFVEDEITTGKTIFHLATKLCKLFGISTIRLFSLADVRTPEEIARFHIALAYQEIRCFTTSVHRIRKDTPADLLPYKTSLSEIPTARTRTPSQQDWHFPHRRPALQSQLNSMQDLPDRLTGCLLVIGEAIDLALQIVQKNPLLSFQHITLSPWKIDRKAIFSCLEIGEKYHLYNYEKLTSSVYLLSDPVDRPIEDAARKILTQRGFKISPLSLAAQYV
jgi:Phosphoribosyl transferase